ncbi:MAG: hypothetical protein Q8R82_14330, partial [Hyphomonadaceae bacterium]|nr:hypothetical protein [Hyphomonadaceae bacterium]
MKRNTALAAICTAALIACATTSMPAFAQTPSATAQADAGLKTAVANTARAEAHKVRDTHRHP